ncbi:MAG: hypothetical protein JNK45_18875 [Myxococcales bacterium]|nr:hypothetical protein [Myxococcales bacterium]
MTRVHLATFALALSGLLPACDGGSKPSENSNQSPFRDKWRTEHEGAFEFVDEMGAPTISSIIVGNSLGSNDNFVNRGDVILKFDGEPNTIKIEFRRFTFAESEEAAGEVYDKLQLWAFNSSTGTPKKPDEMDEEDRCGGENDNGDPYPWQEGCAVYVYYDGQSQLQRAGADIRVTLPADYRESVDVATSDNVIEDSYPNRGNVCVEGLNGTVDIELQNGLAFVSVVAESAYPACPPASVEACENWDDPDTEGPDPWSKNCDCINLGYNPGNVKVESLEPSSANITVDVPADLWTSFRAENAGENSVSGKNCPSTIGAIGSVEYDQGGNDPNKPWLRSGIANKPEAAPAGGFRLDLKSNGCESVAEVEAPKDWDAEITDPESELRGNIEVCAGCLAGKSCEDLLPGG